MTFDIFPKITGKGHPCKREEFLSLLREESFVNVFQKVEDAAQSADKEAYSAAKKQLPCVTWQASFEGGERKNENAKPSGLFMLDVDHIDSPAMMFQEIFGEQEGRNKRCAELGILIVHVTPSGHGLRFVAKCPKTATTIEGCQAWLANELRLLQYDSACKDFARASFLVPINYFLYYDDSIFYDCDDLNILQVPFAAESKPKEAAVVQPQQREFSDAQKTFSYRGKTISEIAAKYVASHGEPQPGERHTYYYNLCRNFRYICDNDLGVLLAQLPDFGLSYAERQKEVEHAVNRHGGDRIPYPFYKFLEREGLFGEEQSASTPEVLKEEETPKTPTLPPVFKEFCSICPKDFVYPSIVALLPILGTLATRLRATYIDGKEQTTSFIGVIFAPQAAGKSFARDIVRYLSKDLRKHDEFSVQKEKLFRAELKQKKNAETIPEDPHAPYRIVQSVISVPRLLGRQEDAGGLHQFSFTEEIDTLVKSNQGGSYAQKSDLYRQAFDNAEYGQDYMSVDTFTGSVRLYYNILMLGTPKQLYKFFNDSENGLVSRCCFAELKNQEFADIPYFKKLTSRQEERITKAMEVFEKMTYARKNARTDEYTIGPLVNVDKYLDETKKVLRKWLEDKRSEALKANDYALDIFRRRAAVKAFRVAMLCVGIYTPSRCGAATRRTIANFASWFAEQDMRQTMSAFGSMIEVRDRQGAAPRKSLFDLLPASFTSADVYGVLRRQGMTSNPTKVIYKWKASGLIRTEDNITFTKKQTKK